MGGAITGRVRNEQGTVRVVGRHVEGDEKWIPIRRQIHWWKSGARIFKLFVLTCTPPGPRNKLAGRHQCWNKPPGGETNKRKRKHFSRKREICERKGKTDRVTIL